MMNPRSICKHYEYCSAPLCPILDDSENQKGIWYPDEEICRRSHKLPVWVRQQKKIARKAEFSSYGFYFDLQMLQNKFRVTRQVRGLNPDRPLETEKKRKADWLLHHRGRKPKTFSEYSKQKKINSMAKARQAKISKIKPTETQ
jgi:hypothetical protein